MEFGTLDEAQKIGRLRRPVNPEVQFNFLAELYVAYIDAYKKLEDSYDQTVHPQKRQDFLKVLEKTLGRLMEIKDQLIMLNVKTAAVNSDFFNLDELFFDLKILPDKLEIPIPRYSKEIDPERIRRRDEMVKLMLDSLVDPPLPEEEEIVYKEFEALPPATLMHYILVNERGRQGIERALKIKADKIEKKKGRAKQNVNDDGEQVNIIQKFYRAFVDRKSIHESRQQELNFLDMIPDDDDELENLDKQVAELRMERKENQLRDVNILKNKRQEIKENMEENEKPDIAEAKLYDMRNWITTYYEDREGKELPKYAEAFYDRHNVAKPLSPEEEEMKKKEAAEKKKAAQKAKKNKGKKKTEREEFLDKMTAIGPEHSKYLKPLQEELDSYTNQWVNKIETDNFEEIYDPTLIKMEVQPEIDQKVEEEVDKIIACELQSLYLKLNMKKPKLSKEERRKRDKIRKRHLPPPTKDPKKKKIPGYKLVGDRQTDDLLKDTAKWGVLKRLKPAKVSDFKGDYNLLRTIQEAQSQTQPDPSLAQLRNRIVEFVGIPLGTFVHNPNALKTFLFYGPQGTGKTLMVRALASECGAIILDISPHVIAGTLTDKKEITKFMYTIFKVAIELQPAIILFDECEQYFPVKKKKPKGVTLGKCTKFKKDLMAQAKKHLKPADRVVIIACTNKPYWCQQPDLKKFFTKKFYFPYPDYTSRMMLFEEMCRKANVKLTPEFPISQLALISEGSTPGSVRKINLFNPLV